MKRFKSIYSHFDIYPMKRYKLIGLSLLFMFFFAVNCNQPAPLPIKEKELALILKDIHIAEAAIQNLVGLTKDSVGEIYYNQIMDLHGVKRVDFDTTMERLRKDPQRLIKIYDQVLLDLDYVADSILYQ